MLYKECMNWLNEVQLFRRGLEQSKEALNQMVIEYGKSDDNDKINNFYQRIQEVGSGLRATEERILCSLNNGKMFWRGPYENISSSASRPNDGNELFDLMKDNYNLLIELQRSINCFLSSKSLV